jgi:hypothetical protein
VLLDESNVNLALFREEVSNFKGELARADQAAE